MHNIQKCVVWRFYYYLLLLLVRYCLDFSEIQHKTLRTHTEHSKVTRYFTEHAHSINLVIEPHETVANGRMAMAMHRIVVDSFAPTTKTMFIVAHCARQANMQDTVLTQFTHRLNADMIISYVIEEPSEFHHFENRRKFNVFIVDGYDSFRCVCHLPFQPFAICRLSVCSN